MFAASVVNAQEPRTRSLTFDRDRRAWVEQSPPHPGTPEGDLHRIQVANADGRHRTALRLSKEFEKQYGRDDALYPELLIQKAEAFIGRRNFTDAHETLQAFLNEFGGMILTDEALRMQMVVAEAFLTGAKRKVWGIFRFSGKDLAYRILDELSAGYPDSRYAEAAIKTKADHLFQQGDFELAELEYARLLREYPRTRYHQFGLQRVAAAALASFAGVEYDEAALIEAAERYREYRATYPADAEREGIDVILEGIRESRAEKDFLIGQYYDRTGHANSAVFYYQSVLDNWPDTIAAAKASESLRLLGHAESSGG